MVDRSRSSFQLLPVVLHELGHVPGDHHSDKSGDCNEPFLCANHGKTCKGGCRTIERHASKINERTVIVYFEREVKKNMLFVLLNKL
mmetsp:Transcript_20569/g.24970  ORF Transcript_20569/g.24970 Transcript_20569/m.24970 type:complete len:87 (+) Transcript_20569:301-561(+)